MWVKVGNGTSMIQDSSSTALARWPFATPFDRYRGWSALSSYAFPDLITHDPQPGPAGSRGRGRGSWERGLPARGMLAQAALRAPSAGKDARDPRKTTTLASPPDRAEDRA